MKGWNDDDFDRYFNKLNKNTRTIILKQVNEFIFYNINNSNNIMDIMNVEDEFRHTLEDIYIVVHRITSQLYKSANFSVESLINSRQAETTFIDFVRTNKSNLTPVYDLLAMHIVLRKKFDYEKYDESFMGELMEELNIFYG